MKPFLLRNYFSLIFGILLLVNSENSHAQELDEVIKSHKTFSLDSLERQLSQLSSQKLKLLFEYDLTYLRSGTIVNSTQINLNGLEGRSKQVGQYLLGDLLKRSNPGRDSLVFPLYFESLKNAEINRDTLVVNEVLERINRLLFKNGKQLKSLKTNLEKYRNYANDTTDRFYWNYHRIGYELLKIEDVNSKIDTLKIESYFTEGFKYANSPFLKGSLLGYQGIFYSAYLKNQDLATELNNLALLELKGNSNHYAAYVVNGIHFNNAINSFEKGNFDEAIPVFKRVLKTEKERVYRMHGYDWLHKCYDSLGDYANAYRYFKKVGAVKDSLSLLEHAREIKAIEAQYDFAAKEQELKQLANEKNKVQTNFNTLVPFFGIALALAFLALLLFRKYRKRSQRLQEEKTATLNRIEQLRKIVIKNHIVLKDKTKVYIADLMFIKAEDHYLKLFLSNGKEHLVRGKIKDIKQQLPPNFIQSHRSYVVNANFIKQSNREQLVLIGGNTVPLSRTYKDRF